MILYALTYNHIDFNITICKSQQPTQPHHPYRQQACTLKTRPKTEKKGMLRVSWGKICYIKSICLLKYPKTG